MIYLYIFLGSLAFGMLWGMFLHWLIARQYRRG